MKLESLEKTEVIPESEVVNDLPKPLEYYSNETQEVVSDSQEETEGLHNRFEGSEIVTDLEMTEGIADYLETVSELKFENWNKLTLAERKDVLNKVEQHIASIEHRPPLVVDLEKMPLKTLGYQSALKHKIALNSEYVRSNNPNIHREVIDTIIHEGRHAYQHYNVDVKTIHESSAEVETWRENFYDSRYKYYQSTGQKIMIPYNDGKLHNVDFRLYYYQPVETDARNFTKDVMTRLEGKGVFQNETTEGRKFDSHEESTVPLAFKGSIGMKLPPLNAEEISKESKGILDFHKKMGTGGEIGEKDVLLAKTEGVPIFDWEKSKFFNSVEPVHKIEVYKDFGTGKLFVKEESGFMAPLEKTDLWKREGFSYSYQNIFGLEVAVKKF